MVNQPLISKKNAAPFALGALGWGTIYGLSISHIFELSPSEVYTDSILTTTTMAFFVILVGNALSYYQPKGDAAYSTLLTTPVGAILFAYKTDWLLSVGGLPDLYLDQSFWFRFALANAILFPTILIALLWYRIEEREETLRRSDETERMQKDAELLKLRAQLQPHFLFNSLNSIGALAGSRPDEARVMVTKLSDFFRGTLQQDDHKLIQLSAELDHLQLYLDIEKVRFSHRLETIIHCNPEAMHLMIPALILQPLMENAVKYGLYGTTGRVVIELQAFEENGYLVVELKNPYDDDQLPPGGTGLGLQILQRRLQLLYSRVDLLKTSKADQIFTASLKIPQTHVQSSNH